MSPDLLSDYPYLSGCSCLSDYPYLSDCSCLSDCPYLSDTPTFVGGNTQTQRVQLDKAGRVGLVIGASIVFEGSDGGVEQRLIRLTTNHGNVAFVQFEPHLAVDVLLRV